MASEKAVWNGALSCSSPSANLVGKPRRGAVGHGRRAPSRALPRVPGVLAANSPRRRAGAAGVQTGWLKTRSRMVPSPSGRELGRTTLDAPARSRVALCSRNSFAARRSGADSRRRRPCVPPPDRPKPPNGCRPDQRPGDAAVEIEISDAELPPGQLQVRRLAAEHAAGQLVGGRVGHVQRLARNRLARMTDQHRAENLLVGQAVLRAGCRRRCAGRRNGLPTRSASPAGTSQASSSVPSLLPISMYSRIFAAAACVDHRADVGARARAGSPIDQRAGRFDQPLRETHRRRRPRRSRGCTPSISGRCSRRPIAARPARPRRGRPIRRR